MNIQDTIAFFQTHPFKDYYMRTEPSGRVVVQQKHFLVRWFAPHLHRSGKFSLDTLGNVAGKILMEIYTDPVLTNAPLASHIFQVIEGTALDSRLEKLIEDIKFVSATLCEHRSGLTYFIEVNLNDTLLKPIIERDSCICRVMNAIDRALENQNLPDLASAHNQHKIWHQQMYAEKLSSMRFFLEAFITYHSALKQVANNSFILGGLEGSLDMVIDWTQHRDKQLKKAIAVWYKDMGKTLDDEVTIIDKLRKKRVLVGMGITSQ